MSPFFIDSGSNGSPRHLGRTAGEGACSEWIDSDKGANDASGNV